MSRLRLKTQDYFQRSFPAHCLLFGVAAYLLFPLGKKHPEHDGKYKIAPGPCGDEIVPDRPKDTDQCHKKVSGKHQHPDGSIYSVLAEEGWFSESDDSAAVVLFPGDRSGFDELRCSPPMV